ncbi:MAG: tetratricopeptide repeat protein [Candidatus Aminicenantes bacterium]|nr:tetratricopeptide repeat protein [Candidatus Aminicenantes bacterium]NIN23073.1 tetratricopeptide repeat protein [Candidatus Aminicenantes bacterium]NIN46800.1 tetratricopeptide repeat protein [Candidatus Aminicenantes bacterium]NIN89722.1 tetratricopeptide repeat protein [Candidatus Aminicenantes bacterium]NIO86265.1 tetratricopeptide repeat protein [Candidatus Aminicenantes bacterium]
MKREEYAETAYNLGNVYFLQLKYKEALDSYLEADRLDPGNAEYKNSIGLCHLELGNYQPAGEYFATCLELNRKACGDGHGKVATSWNNLGLAYDSLGRCEMAIQYFKKALPIFEKFLGKEHPSTKTVQENLEMARKRR